jgi:nucleoside-diphosphate-sugar epimerase
MRQISILGCGWLGLPLARQLIQNGYVVKGSTTSPEKLALLQYSAIIPYEIAVSEEEIDGPIDAFLDKSAVLIIDIPPKLRGVEKDDFVAKIQTLIPHIEKSTVSKVIFVSSTSVYEDVNGVVTEDSVHKPATESGRQLLASELVLQSNTNFQTTIVRFGGLIGEDRHPIRFLAGRKNIENPEAPINLIHLDDCIGIISSIVALDCWNEIFNAVTPFHPSRKKYYEQKALEMKLDLPEFDIDSISKGKTISSDKIQNVLKYEFKINPL